MLRRKYTILTMFFLFFIGVFIVGNVYGEPINDLAKKMAVGLKKEKNKKVAVLPFVNSDGITVPESTLIQERLTTALVNIPGVEVIERMLIDKVLQEIKLGVIGIVDSDKARQIGKLSGADIIITGTIHDLNEKNLEINARAILTSTGKIIVADRLILSRTSLGLQSSFDMNTNSILPIVKKLEKFDSDILITTGVYPAPAKIMPIKYSWSSSFIISPDSQYLARRTYDSLELWRINPWKRLWDMDLHSYYTYDDDIAFSPNNRLLLYVDESKIKLLKLQDLSTRKTIASCNEKAEAHHISFSPSGAFLATLCDTNLSVFDTDTWDSIDLLKFGEVTAYAFSPGDNNIVIGTKDGILRIYTIPNKVLVKSVRLSSIPEKIKYSNNGKYLIVQTSSENLRQITTIRTIDWLQEGTTIYVTQPVNSIDFSPNDKYLLVGTDEYNCRLYTIPSLEEIVNIRGCMNAKLDNSGEFAYFLSDSSIELYHLPSLLALNKTSIKTITSPHKIISGFEETVYSLSISPDNQYLLAGDLSGIFKLWDFRKLKIIYTEKSNCPVYWAGFSNNSQTYVISTGYCPSKIFNVNDNKFMFEFARNGRVNEVAFSPDDQLMVAAVDESIELFQKTDDNWTKIGKLSGHNSEVTTLQFSPDGQKLVSGGRDGRLFVWDTKTWKTLNIFDKHANKVERIKFSPNGEYMASASKDKSIIIWRTKDWTPIRLFLGHTGDVEVLIFFLGGKFLISAGADGTARIWDMESGRCKLIFRSGSWIRTGTVTNDNKWLITGHGDRTIKFWRIPSIKELDNQ